MKTINVTGIGHIEIDTNETNVELAGDFVGGQSYNRSVKRVFNNKKYQKEALENGIRYYLKDCGNNIFILADLYVE